MEAGSGSIGAVDDSVGAGLFQPQFLSILRRVVSGLIDVDTIESGDQATCLTAGRQADTIHLMTLSPGIITGNSNAIDLLAANEDHVTITIGTENVTCYACA
jgi:hypothetical protein